MKSLHTLAAALVLLSMASCVTVLPGYTPNAPFLKEKGDLRASGSAVVGNATLGANVNLAYATSDHFYLGAGTSILSHGGESSSFTDLSMGYYGIQGQHLAYEFSVGGGLGSFDYGSSYKEKLGRYHGQAAAAYSSKRFLVGGGIRMAHNSYRSDGKMEEKNTLDGITLLDEDRSNIWSAEPFMMIRVGGPKTSFQFTATYPIVTKSLVSVYPDFTLSLGMSFSLGRNRKK